jgi:hypothetical protein
MLYGWGWNDVLRAYRFKGDCFETSAASRGTVMADFPGGTMSVSADGDRAGSGIVWVTTPKKSAEYYTVPGTLRAFDAADVSRELWNSDQNASRDLLFTYAKFVPPVVANGKVYVATFSKRLSVYGLLPDSQGH